jgi:hypothetical protein
MGSAEAAGQANLLSADPSRFRVRPLRRGLRSVSVSARSHRTVAAGLKAFRHSRLRLARRPLSRT